MFISGTLNSLMRKIFVLVHFTIAITLIACTLVIYKQIHYMKNRNPGFTKEQMVYIPLKGELGEKRQIIIM